MGRSGSSSKKRKMWLFKRLKMKESWRWRLRFLVSAFKWKRLNIQLSLLDDLLFKIISVLEAIVLAFAIREAIKTFAHIPVVDTYEGSELSTGSSEKKWSASRPSDDNF
ncbi:hypothetical protein D5086_008792 [Populus alba]|uniref:Uncharacterized protein n=1 Tax=Populus alba TaxID=43335 RepID=A0ACC4CGL0_POPAL